MRGLARLPARGWDRDGSRVWRRSHRSGQVVELSSPPGWKIVTVLPNPGGAAPLQEWSLVAIADKSQAIRAIKARHPHAAIRVDSEADAELLAKYGVLDGKIFVLVEGT